MLLHDVRVIQAKPNYMHNDLLLYFIDIILLIIVVKTIFMSFDPYDSGSLTTLLLIFSPCNQLESQ